MAAPNLVMTKQEQMRFGARLTAALPEGAAGQWVRLRVDVAGAAWWAKLELADDARGQIVREVFLGRCGAGPAGGGGKRWYMCRRKRMHWHC